MIVDHIYQGEQGVQFVVTLVCGPQAVPVGKVPITPRWRAAGRRLLSEHELDKDLILSGVRASVTGHNDRYQTTQQYQLSFTTRPGVESTC